MEMLPDSSELLVEICAPCAGDEIATDIGDTVMLLVESLAVDGKGSSFIVLA